MTSSGRNRPEDSGSRADRKKPEEPGRHQKREENLDKTIEDSFPASDPPSTLPDPHTDEQ